MLILSSRMRPKEQFEGYAFVGTDYVHGPAGMTAYRARTGRTVGPGEDGCYVVARRAGRLFGRRFEVGTDASGLGRLFLTAAATIGRSAPPTAGWWSTCAPRA